MKTFKTSFARSGWNNLLSGIKRTSTLLLRDLLHPAGPLLRGSALVQWGNFRTTIYTSLLLPANMDFEGQKTAEALLMRLLIAFAAIGFLAGYATGNFALMVYINAAGLCLTLLAVVPDWPFFRRHPLDWLPPLNPGQKKEEAATPTRPAAAKGRKA